MAQYTPREYAEMHLIYGECGCVGRVAARLYRERYPNRRHPDHRVFSRVHSAYSEGRLPGTGVGGASDGRPRVYDDGEIMDLVHEDPTTSVRAIARRTGKVKIDEEENAGGEEEKKRQKRGGKGMLKSKKKEDVPKLVQVSRAPRGKKKSVTVVSGLSTFDIDLKVAAKFFGTKFACGSSVTGDDEIVIQGDVKDDLFDIIPEKWPEIDEDSIEDLGDQKR